MDLDPYLNYDTEPNTQSQFKKKILRYEPIFSSDIREILTTNWLVSAPPHCMMDGNKKACQQGQVCCFQTGNSIQRKANLILFSQAHTALYIREKHFNCFDLCTSFECINMHQKITYRWKLIRDALIFKYLDTHCLAHGILDGRW